MKVLVLGGSGFIGSHIVNKLIHNGHDVHVFDQRKPNIQSHYLQYTVGNLNDSDLILSILNDIDIVFHCISTTVPITSNLDPIYDVNTNLVSALELFNKIITQKKPPRIIYLSSGGTVYGENSSKTPFSENHPTNPICSYGIVKLAIEKYLFMYNKLYGLNYIILRLSNPYGLGQGNTGIQGVISTFVKKITNGEEINVWGNGNATKDYIHIDDVSDACLKAMEYNKCGTFNIGSGNGYSVNRILEILKSISKEDLKIRNIENKKHDVDYFVLNNSLAKKLLEWEPHVNLEDGIKRMMESQPK